MNLDADARPAWHSALARFVERDDYVVELKTPISMVTGRIIDAVPAVFLRFPRWTGDPFVDDFGKKSSAMIDLDGEHLFPELAILRLLEAEGWSGRWVNTYSGKGEVWKYLTEWKDVPRAEQRNRPIEEAEPRQLLARIAGLNKPARYAGCWDTFAWRGPDAAFFQCKRTTPKPAGQVRTEQEDWLRSALYAGDPRVTLQSFCFVQWDFQ
jgi:hypothetical protein